MNNQAARCMKNLTFHTISVLKRLCQTNCHTLFQNALHPKAAVYAVLCSHDACSSSRTNQNNANSRQVSIARLTKIEANECFTYPLKMQQGKKTALKFSESSKGVFPGTTSLFLKALCNENFDPIFYH